MRFFYSVISQLPCIGSRRASRSCRGSEDEMDAVEGQEDEILSLTVEKYLLVYWQTGTLHNCSLCKRSVKPSIHSKCRLSVEEGWRSSIAKIKSSNSYEKALVLFKHLLPCQPCWNYSQTKTVSNDVYSLATKINVRLDGILPVQVHAQSCIHNGTNKNIYFKNILNLVIHVCSRQHVSISENKVRVFYAIKFNLSRFLLDQNLNPIASDVVTLLWFFPTLAIQTNLD